MLNQLKNDHCVYGLYDNLKNLRYLGEGRCKRPFSRSGRTPKYLEILDNGGFVSIIEEGLTKIESRQLEAKLISEELEKGAKLINRITSSVVKPISYEFLSQFFKIDTSSPSNLAWNVTRKNVKTAGQPAGVKTPRGYYIVTVKKKGYRAHRVVWCLANKRDLSELLVINHIDGNPSNNCISNLEAVSTLENCNKKVNIPNKDKLGFNLMRKRKNDNGRLIVSFRFNDKTYSKEYSVNKYGYDLAMSMAREWKAEKLLTLQKETEDIVW